MPLTYAVRVVFKRIDGRFRCMRSTISKGDNITIHKKKLDYLANLMVEQAETAEKGAKNATLDKHLINRLHAVTQSCKNFRDKCESFWDDLNKNNNLNSSLMLEAYEEVRYAIDGARCYWINSPTGERLEKDIRETAHILSIWEDAIAPDEEYPTREEREKEKNNVHTWRERIIEQNLKMLRNLELGKKEINTQNKGK